VSPPCGRTVDSDAVSRQRSSAPDPGSPARPVDAPPGTTGDGAHSNRSGVRSDELNRLVSVAHEHADLGLPVAQSERFRPAKRLVSRVCWIFLRHQVAFNHATIEAIQELSEHVSGLEQRVKDDLLDFADRSASQAQAEISDQVADARSIHAELVLELRRLQAELDSGAKRVAFDPPPEQGNLELDTRRNITGSGDGGTERR
jgi:hypothetical protein